MKQEYTFICDAGALMIGHPDFVVRMAHMQADAHVTIPASELYDAAKSF